MLGHKLSIPASRVLLWP